MRTNRSAIRTLVNLGVLALSALLVSTSGLATLAAQQPAPRKPPPEPYFDGRKQELEYPGSGRELPDPEGLTEVRIGYFGPYEPDHPLGGDSWLGAQLAIQEANSTGGYKGIPFRLLPAWSENPWSAGIAQVTRLVFQDQVWALIGSIDGSSTHLVEQVVTKALVTLVNPGSTDDTVNYAYVPWMFSVPPSDGQQAPLLGAAVKQATGQRRFVVLSANDHDSQVAMTQFTSFLARQGMTPVRAVQFKSDSPDSSGTVAEALAAIPDVVLVCAGAADSAAIVRQLREAGCRASIFGSSTMGRSLFLARAGADAEGVIFPLLYEPSPGYEDFSAKFRKQFGRDPDFTASQAYDTTRLLLEAVARGGINRARIRDAVRDLAPWQGVTGVIQWDALGQNVRPVRLGTIRGGRIVEVK